MKCWVGWNCNHGRNLIVIITLFGETWHFITGYSNKLEKIGKVSRIPTQGRQWSPRTGSLWSLMKQALMLSCRISLLFTVSWGLTRTVPFSYVVFLHNWDQYYLETSLLGRVSILRRLIRMVKWHISRHFLRNLWFWTPYIPLRSSCVNIMVQCYFHGMPSPTESCISMIMFVNMSHWPRG